MEGGDQTSSFRREELDGSEGVLGRNRQVPVGYRRDQAARLDIDLQSAPKHPARIRLIPPEVFRDLDARDARELSPPEPKLGSKLGLLARQTVQVQGRSDLPVG